MLRSSFRPLARAASSARAYSTSRPPTSFNRTAVLASLTLTIGALAWSANSSTNHLHADAAKSKSDTLKESLPSGLKNENVRESVLDQKSLKEPIHKRQSESRFMSKVHRALHGEPEAEPSSEDVIEKKAAEASKPSEGAFNEETGEINWDCPCLGGMADGPCGEAFKAAFSCFVYSEQEPKGVECVDKFKAMQDCFREHPDVYGEEIDDEDELDEPLEDPRPVSHQKGPPAPPNAEPPRSEDGTKKAHR